MKEIVRFDFGRSIPTVALLLLGWGLGSSETRPLHAQEERRVHSAVSDQPNVLLITIDTLRADRLSTYGYRLATDLNMRSLAREGILFEDVLAPVPLTLPSHLSLLTGLYPMTHGVRDNDQPWKGQGTSIAKLFKDRGYETVAWVSSIVLSSRFGLAQGFDLYDDHFVGSLRHGGPIPLERNAAQTIEGVEEWLGGRKTETPFFAWIHLFDPHTPYDPPHPYSTRFSSAYDAEIAYADAQVGKLFDELRKKGLWRNTLVAVTSDHGEGLGEHEENTHGYFVYQSTLRVPLIVKLPGESHAGKRIMASIHQIDIAPNLLRFAGLPVPKSMPGQIWSDLFRGEASLPTRASESAPIRAARRPEGLYAESYYFRFHFNWAPLRVLRQGRYKLIAAPEPELYDLATDPGEEQNLFPRQRALGQALLARLDSLVRKYSTQQPNAPGGGQHDTTTLERLRSLGYSSLGSRAMPLKESSLADPKLRMPLFRKVVASEHLIEKKNISGATASLREVLAEDSNLLRARELLALILEDAGRWNEAAAEYQLLHTALPFSPYVAAKLGMVYARLGEPAKGLTLLEKALLLDPNDFYLHYNRGHLEEVVGKAQAALKSYARSVELEPHFAQSRFNLGQVLLRERRPEEALRHLAAAVEIDPGWKEPHNSRGICFAVLGRLEDAMDAWKSALELDPRYSEARANLAQMLEDLGRAKEAEEHRAILRGQEKTAPL